MEAIDSPAGVETTIEAQDAVDPGRAHHGHVKDVPCGEAVHRFHERFGGADLGHAEGQDVVDSRIATRKRGVDGVKLSNRCVAMKYLLVDLHVRRKTFSISHQPRQHGECAVLVRMWSSHQAHRRVGVNKRSRGTLARLNLPEHALHVGRRELVP